MHRSTWPKKSQSYPGGFGRAVARLYQRYSEYLVEKANAACAVGLNCQSEWTDGSCDDNGHIMDCIEAMLADRLRN
eukprot:5315671-Alexandrium_andersonii.AAC.1